MMKIGAYKNNKNKLVLKNTFKYKRNGNTDITNEPNNLEMYIMI